MNRRAGSGHATGGRSLCGRIAGGLALAVLLAGAGAGIAVAQGTPNVVAPEVPQARRPNEIVGLLLRNPTGGAAAPGFVTFGQVFQPGQVRRGTALALAMRGRDEPAQMDVKATNPDGSVRMAVVTVAAPALPAHGTVPAMLVTGPGMGAGTGGAAVPLAADTGLEVALTVRGETAPRIIRLDGLLGAALATGGPTAGANPWLAGPLATEARLDAPVAGSLHVLFDVRRHADRSVAIDVIFANDIAMRPGGGDAAYDVTISQGGKLLLHKAGIRQFDYTVWHHVFRSGGAAEDDVVHDIAYLERTGAILDYDLRAGAARSALADELAALSKGGPAFDILGNAGLATYMPMSGGRPDIGPTTEANAIWLVTQNPIAAAYALAQADASGSVPWHMFDPQAGTYLTTLGHPDIWADTRGGTHQTSGLTQPPRDSTDNCGCWSPDPAHQPDLSTIPYLLTGSRYRLDELTAQAAWDVINTWPGPRKNGEGIVADIYFQVRQIAWNLRDIGNAAYILPDTHPLKRYFATLLERNLAYLLTTAHGLEVRQGETHGWLESRDPGTPFELAPWQQDYLGLMVALAAKQGAPGARDLLAWESHFLVGRFLAADRGFSPYDGAAYQLVVAPSPGTNWVSTWREVAALTEAAGYSGCPVRGSLAGCGWAKNAFPQYQHQALAVVAETARVLHTPDAAAAAAWLVRHVALGNTATADDVRFNIAPP